MSTESETIKAERIAWAKRRLAALAKTMPSAVDRMKARQARLDTAAKRERERQVHLVSQAPRPAAKITHVRQRGKRRTIRTPVELDTDVERIVAQREAGKGHGTPETEAAYLRAHQGSLADLRQRGTIDATQLASAEQIRRAHEVATSDVAVRGVSYEMRIDGGARVSGDMLVDSLSSARMQVAYALWRQRIPVPKSAILDMLVDQPVGYTLVETRYRMRHGRGKELLIKALDLWTECVDDASATITSEALNASWARIAAE